MSLLEKIPNEKPKRKFIAIAKVDAEKFVKYRTNKPENCIKFLHKKFPLLRFVNFFFNKGPHKSKLYATYGTKKGLIIN